MKPDLSEFSYGYAVTESLIRNAPFPLEAAPLFPSLIQEGQSGGYDVRIPFRGYPLFLQFKLADCMVRNTAFECRERILSPDFYRMYLRSTKYSQQHPMLLDLESSGSMVFYVAPIFHTIEKLNEFYLNSSVIQNSIFIRPSDIGPMSEEAKHHVSYKATGPVYLCSKPRKIMERNKNDDFWHRLRQLTNNNFIIDNSEESKKKLLNNLLNVVEGHHLQPSWFKRQDDLSKFRQMEPAFQIGYITRTILECEFFVYRTSD